jgi:hypothetical protein
MTENGLVRRLWRLRKLHDSVDAELIVSGGDGGVVLRFLYNGELTYTRQLASRLLAVEEARARRAELEREGWMFHW